MGLWDAVAIGPDSSVAPWPDGCHPCGSLVCVSVCAHVFPCVWSDTHSLWQWSKAKWSLTHLRFSGGRSEPTTNTQGVLLTTSQWGHTFIQPLFCPLPLSTSVGHITNSSRQPFLLSSFFQEKYIFIRRQKMLRLPKSKRWWSFTPYIWILLKVSSGRKKLWFYFC